MHSEHGRESSEDYPNATHCPCVGVADAATVKACADSGCRYCRITTVKAVLDTIKFRGDKVVR